jgi:hypothetical protein
MLVRFFGLFIAVLLVLSLACSDDGTPAADLGADSVSADAPAYLDFGPVPDMSTSPDSPPTPDGLPDAAPPPGTWTKATSPLTHTWWGVWGSGPNDVWAVGVAGKIIHYTSGTWTEVSSGYTQNIRGIWGKDGSDIWAAGADGWIGHYDGTSWTSTKQGTDNFFNVGGDPATGEVWVVGENGKILHNKGSGWTDESVSGVTEMLMGIWVHSPTDAWAVGWHDTILHYDGTKWTPNPSGTAANFEAVWGTSAAEVWIAGKDIVMRRKAGGWLVEPSLIGTQAMFNNWQAVGGTSASDVWIVGDKGLMLRFDGNVWKDIPGVDNRNLYGMHFVSPTEAWAVGVQGTLLHYAPKP